MKPFDFTTADRGELKRVYDAIARDIGDDRFFTTKELDVLPKLLSPREQVLSFSSGIMDGGTWLIVLTDARVLFVDKGMVWGLKQTSIELSNIVSIQGETGIMFGSIKIGVASGTQEIRNVWKRTVNSFVNKVREARIAMQRGEQMYAPGTGPDADQEPADEQPRTGPSPASPTGHDQYQSGAADSSAPPPVAAAYATPLPAPPPVSFPPPPEAMAPPPPSFPPPPVFDQAASSTPIPAPTPAPVPASTQHLSAAEMARLDRLRRSGAMTEEEYRRRTSGAH